MWVSPLKMILFIFIIFFMNDLIEFLFFRWNNKLCTWLPQLFCIHWCSIPRKACCCHCGMYMHVILSNHMIMEYWRKKVLVLEIVSLYFTQMLSPLGGVLWWAYVLEHSYNICIFW
jgi:hypothetical protein